MNISECNWSLSNPGPKELMVWLEPWADELIVPVWSTIALKAKGIAETCTVGDIEWVSDHVVVWSTATTIEVSIDGELQRTSSAIVPIPDGLTKEMLGIVFSGQPAARLGGRSSGSVNQRSFWHR